MNRIHRRLDDSAVRIVFEDSLLSDHPQTRNVFQFSVIRLASEESALSPFGPDGQIDPVSLGYTGTGFPGAIVTAPQNGEPYSIFFRSIDGIDFTRVSWSSAGTIVREGQILEVTMDCFTYWGRRDDVLILMTGVSPAGTASSNHPCEAMAESLQHGIEEAFIPAIGVRPMDYPKFDDIPRDKLKKVDDF